MVENVDRLLRESEPGESRLRVVARACGEVAKPIAFSLLIIVIVFLPLFTLQGVEGKTFTPLAQTMSFGMLGSLIFAMTLVPVLASLLMRRPKSAGRGGEHKEFIVLRWLLGLPAGRLFLRQKALGAHRPGGRCCSSAAAFSSPVSGRNSFPP